MLSYRNKPALRANGTINPGTFVKMDTTATFMCLACAAGDTPIGIAQLGQEYAPATFGSTTLPTFAAQQNDPIHVFFDGEYTEVLVGATVTAGQLLTPDANGFGVPALGGQAVGCYTLAAGSANDLVPCVVRTIPSLTANAVVTAAANTTLTVNQLTSRSFVNVTATGVTITLPVASTVPGAEVQIFNTVASSNTAILPGNGTDAVFGDNLTIAAGHGIINTAAGAHVGDTVLLVSDGVSKWSIAAIIGTWAAD